MVSIQGTNPIPENQGDVAQNVQIQQQKAQPNTIFYSKYDNNPKDGTVSSQEQQENFLSKITANLKERFANAKMSIEQFAKDYTGFADIKTDGTETSAIEADAKVLGNFFTAQRVASDEVSKLENPVNDQQELSYADKMQQTFGDIEGAKYIKHPNSEISEFAGQVRKNGENVIVIKRENGEGYVTFRQTVKNKAETKEYKNLDELKQDMASEDFGWGRNTWDPNGRMVFSIGDVLFRRSEDGKLNGLIEVHPRNYVK